MPFSTVVGHASVIAGLRAAHAHNRVAHAYLFCGPDGVGKERVATAFIQLLICANRPTSDEACGECRHCRLVADGRHPDLCRVEPEAKFIKIEQVRQLTKRLRFPPVEASTRAFVIREAHLLHPAAANALLKTLEEPSANNIFILITSQPNVLLATIRSRCQEVRFTHLHRETVATWLREHDELDAQAADELAAMSGGSIGRAVQLTDSDLVAMTEQWLTHLAGLQQLRDSEILMLAQTLAGDKKVLPLVLDVFRAGLRDALLLASGVDSSKTTFRGRAPLLPDQGTPAILSALTQIDDVEKALFGNVNPRLCAEQLLLGLRRTLISQ